MATIVELRKSRSDLWEKMKNFLDTHEQKDGRLSVDDTATYENMEKEMADFDAAISRAENREKRDAEMAELVGSPIKNMPNRKGGIGRDSKEYADAFVNYIKTKRASNALQEDTASEGGYLVPTEFERTLFEARDSVDPIFQLAGKISLGALEKKVPYVASQGAAALIAEEGSYGETDDAFAQVTFHAYKFGRICKASEELIADSAFNIQSYLAGSFGKAIGKCQAGYYWTGTGSSQPQGVMTAAGAGVTTAAADKITADELIDLFYSLDENYRDYASWAMNNTTVKAIRKLKLGTGEYLWAPGFGDAPATILGRPLYTSANIDAIDATKKVIAFGDFAECYKIADRQGVDFKVLNELYAATGQVGFRGSARSDGKGILASTGIKVLTMHA